MAILKQKIHFRIIITKRILKIIIHILIQSGPKLNHTLNIFEQPTKYKHTETQMSQCSFQENTNYLNTHAPQPQAF